jgi:hypothetical protein
MHPPRGRLARGGPGRRERGARVRLEPPPQAPRRAGERVIRNGREARLVGAEGEQQVRDPV